MDISLGSLLVLPRRQRIVCSGRSTICMFALTHLPLSPRRQKRRVCNRSAYSRHVDRKKYGELLRGNLIDVAAFPERFSRKESRHSWFSAQNHVRWKVEPPVRGFSDTADLRSLFPVRRRDPTPGPRYRCEEFVPLASKQRRGWIFDEPTCPQSKLGPNTTVVYSAMGPGTQKGPPLASSDFH